MTTPTLEEMNDELDEMKQEIIDSDDYVEGGKCPSCDEPTLLLSENHGEICESCGYHCRR